MQNMLNQAINLHAYHVILNILENVPEMSKYNLCAIIRKNLRDIGPWDLNWTWACQKVRSQCFIDHDEYFISGIC